MCCADLAESVYVLAFSPRPASEKAREAETSTSAALSGRGNVYIIHKLKYLLGFDRRSAPSADSASAGMCVKKTLSRFVFI